MIRQMQQANTLRPGDRLPSLRNLSNRLAVSVPTVQLAYAELERQGLIESRPKSGYFLMPAKLTVPAPDRVPLAEKPMAVSRQQLIEQVFAVIHKPGVVPLGVANPASAHSSDKALARAMRKVLAKAGSKATAYAPMYGYAELKRQISLRYFELGIQLDDEEVLITNGAQEAIAIALQCVAQPGDVIAVESPTYFGVLELIESLGMLALEIPLCPEQGIWLEDLQKAITKHPIKACIFSSAISNPLGSMMSDARRAEIVTMLEAADIPLIEDDVYGELQFDAAQATPAQRYSKKGLVLTCSSFSKTIAPGYRVGWLLAGKFAHGARRYKRALSCSSSLLSQWTLAELLASGEYRRNLERLRTVLMRNKALMVQAVKQFFPQGTRINDPRGGSVVWVELPAGCDSQALFHLAMESNISIAPGALFSPSDKFSRCIRISYGLPWTDQVDGAIAELGSLVKGLLDTTGRESKRQRKAS